MANRRLTDLFLELARLDGVPGKEAQVASRLLSFLKGLGLQPLADGSAAAALSNTSNVVCHVGGGGTFALVAHMDTLRHTSRVKQVVSLDRITGEGGAPGADGRAPLAAVLYALERAVSTNQPLRPFTLAFTTRGCSNNAGARHLALPPGVRSAFVLAPGLQVGTYTVSSPGIAIFSADVLGRAADAAAPEQGICAISIAARAIAAFPWGRHDPDTTSNIGTIAGGAGTAIVPPAALARGQVRAMAEVKALPLLERIKGEFEKAASAAGGAAAFKWSWEYAPYAHAEEADIRRQAETALRGAGLTPAPAGYAPGGEANALNARGVPALALGTGVMQPGAAGEHVLLEDMARTAELVWQFIKRP